ncbi:XRE family transcriptional regulator [Aerophototrophica crusticola]|uniref:XRE family transcriptional regulator n=1 Tax=Aerophototrophica crusticola TaxID=1709002 RepID=A0A858RA07_9PROT|nr:XRE family transcriptional regulator [Rhodospirillaceae bacterium B3]
MTGHTPFSKLRAGLPPERQQRAAQKTAALRERMALHEVREARRLTQASLADTLGVDQSAVAKMEKRTDMYVGNLRRFVAAMGGELQIIARFPEGDVVIDNFAGLGEPADPAASTGAD